MNYSIPGVYNKIFGNTTTGSVVQQVSTSVVPEKKDSFEKSNHKTLAITSAGAMGGGIAGAIYAKITEAARAIPNSILNKYDKDYSTLGAARAEVEERVWKDEFEPLLKSMVNKLLNKEELTPEELKLAKDIDLDPNMVRFFDRAKLRAKSLADAINEHSNNQSVLYLYSVHSPMDDKYSLSSTLDLSKWLNSIGENGLKYSDNEEFLDYASSEFFKDITFKIKYNKDGVANGIIPSIDFKNAIPGGETLSDNAYSFKELVEKVIVKKEFGHNPYVDSSSLSELGAKIGVSENNNHPQSAAVLKRRFNELCDAAVDKAKAVNQELKSNAIKTYNNKQILKYAGIGALIAGVLATCGSLVYKKIKEKNHN